MDECFLLGDSDLFFEHVAATSDSELVDLDPEEAKAHLKSIQPSFSQLRNCINANRAYKSCTKPRANCRNAAGCGPRRFLYVPAQSSGSTAHGPFQDQDR